MAVQSGGVGASAGRPRVLRVDLLGVARPGPLGPAARLGPWSSADPALDRVGSWSGLALALALLEEASRAAPDAPPPLVLAIGECVRRGVPTAARATVASRAPLTGRLADGQVGGDLGRRLASVADALELRGATQMEGAVLVLRADGSALLESRPELGGAPARARHERLRELHGPCAVLCVGPGGERGLPFASLVASGEVPHFVGRGGLGALLGRAGLAALVIDAPEVEGVGDRLLHEALIASPRLEGRARGGTLELFDAWTARGALGPEGRAVGAELERARTARHGCSGCPTPCGWIFRGPGGRGQGARFGAAHALGLRLGLDRAEDALALLSWCDDAGLDAKEVGAGLALLRIARERGLLPGGATGPGREPLERWLEELLAGRGEGARLASGATALARALALEDELAALASTPARAGDDLAALLAGCVTTRGPDPMRAFPALLHDVGDELALARLVAPMPLPPGAADPRLPAGKGRLVAWQEDLAAAVDASGFCAFSAAALLADGELDLERLAAWIEPAALAGEGGTSAAARFAGMGAALVHLARRLDERWSPLADRERAPRAARWLDLPGMWDEYARARGLDDRGRLTASTRARFDAGETLDGLGRPPAVEAPAAPRGAPAAREVGRVTLCGSGPLSAQLGPAAAVELALPAAAAEVLAAAAERYPAARAALLAGERPRVAIYRDGRRVAANDEVRSGERLDLVLVISGGAR